MVLFNRGLVLLVVFNSSGRESVSNDQKIEVGQFTITIARHYWDVSQRWLVGWLLLLLDRNHHHPLSCHSHQHHLRDQISHLHYLDKYLYLSPLLWCKTSILNCQMSGRESDTFSCFKKMRSIFLMSLALSVQIFNKKISSNTSCGNFQTLAKFRKFPQLVSDEIFCWKLAHIEPRVKEKMSSF